MKVRESSNVDYRLLSGLSNLVICSRCFQEGVITPVPQVISKRHRPNNVCSRCRPMPETSATVDRSLRRRRILRLLGR